MIVFGDSRRFVPRESTGLVTADGARLTGLQLKMVQGLALCERSVPRVYLGGETVFNSAPKSYFYLQLTD